MRNGLLIILGLLIGPSVAYPIGAFYKKHATALVFIRGSSVIYPDQCSSDMYVKMINFKGEDLTPAVDTNMTITTTGPIQIYADSGCLYPFSGSPYISTYDPGFAFWVKGTGTGAGVITVTSADGTVRSARQEITSAAASPFRWKGGGGNSNWTNNANWYSGYAPSPSDIAVFDGTCVSCNVTINAAVNVYGIQMRSDYTGTITQGTRSVSLDSAGFVQAGGTWTGGSGALTAYGVFAQTGGTFTAPTNLNVNTLSTATTYFITTGGTFTPGSGTITLGGYNWFEIQPGTASYNNVKFNTNSSFNVVNTSMTINGTFTNAAAGGAAHVLLGTIIATGNVVLQGSGFSGTGLLKLAGTSQTISFSGTTSSTLPSLEIASSGTVTLNAGTVYVSGNYTYTSGTLAFNASSTLALRYGFAAAARFGTYTYPKVTVTPLYSHDTFNILDGLNAGVFQISDSDVHLPNPGTGKSINVTGQLKLSTGTRLYLHGGSYSYGSISSTGGSSVTP